MRRLELLPSISKIGLGAWQFGAREWGYGESYAAGEAARIVRRAVELGVTLFDTAEVYGLGRSERILGAALADDRERVFIATKIFPILPLAPVVEQRAVASANRLGVRRIDLYQVHQPNPLVPDATTMRGMRVLQAVGLVGEVGVSNYSLARWRRAEAALGSRVLSDQVSYSLVHRDPEEDLIPYARAHGRLVIAWSPLGKGFLTGSYSVEQRPSNLLRRCSRLFGPESFARAQPLLRTLREIADAHGATQAQIALAWTIRESCVVAIAGASSVAQVEANAAAAAINLTDGEVAALDDASTSYASSSGR